VIPVGLAWSGRLGRQAIGVRRSPASSWPNVLLGMPLLRTGASPCRGQPGGDGGPLVGAACTRAGRPGSGVQAAMATTKRRSGRH